MSTQKLGEQFHESLEAKYRDGNARGNAPPVLDTYHQCGIHAHRAILFGPGHESIASRFEVTEKAVDCH